jgi:hypothetical protein
VCVCVCVGLGEAHQTCLVKLKLVFEWSIVPATEVILDVVCGA